MYNASDNAEVTKLTTGADGTSTFSLDPGSYYLKELQAPYGFLIEQAKINFTVTAGATVTVEVTDQRDWSIPSAPQSNIDMPKTGETFPTTNYVFGAALLILAVICGVQLRSARKKSKRKASQAQTPKK